MIRAIFMQGANIRKMAIDKEIITLISSETNYEPIQLKLNEMLKPGVLDKIKGSNEWVNEVKALKSEMEMLKDIKKDFKKTGWRLVLYKEENNE